MNYFFSTVLYFFSTLVLGTSALLAEESSKGFIENKGQIAEKNGKLRNDISFKLELPNVNAYFKPNGIIYHFYESTDKKKENYSKQDLVNFNKGDNAAISKTVRFFRLDLNLLGANEKADFFSSNIQKQKYNYYLPHCPQGITNLNSYNEITYTNIYPNIDIKYYFVDNKLKYEFIVHPGGDLNNIKFIYNGANSTQIIDGKLKVENDFNTIIEEQPYCYYQNSKKVIGSKFKLDGKIVSFDLNNFDIKQTIIIDPTITWASYYSNTYSSDFHCNSAFDSQNNIYTAFATYGNTWPTINAGGSQYYDVVKDGITDLVIAKINANYSKQWATYYGGDGGDYLLGTGGDYGKTLGIDANDNLYVGGYANNASIFPTLSSASGGAFYQNQTKLYGGDNSFLLKFDSNGARQWATLFQHEQNNTNSAGMQINGLYVGNSKIYFTGQTYRFGGNDIPLRTLAGGYNNSTFVGDQDIFIGRFDANCVLEWCTYFNGGNASMTAFKQGSDLHIDALGNLIFTGQISGSNPTSGYLLNPGGGAYYTPTISGNSDVIIAKFNGSMQPVWSTYYGGVDIDRVSEVSSDINGNILLAFRAVGGSGFPTLNPGGAFYYSSKQSPGTWSGGAGGSYDGGIAKFTPNGSLYWSTYVGGTSANSNSITGIASDNSGNIYTIGYTNTNNFPIQNLAGSYNQSSSGGGVDMIVMKFSSAGVLSWSSYYGGSGDDACYGVKLTPSTTYSLCNVYKQFNAFSTTSPNDLPTVNPGNPAFYESTKPTTNANAVLLIEDIDPLAVSTPPSSILGTSTICAPNSTTLSTNGGVLVSGSVWTWHIDSCAGPVIGTGTSISVNPTSTTTYYVNAIGTCDTSACTPITITVNSNTTGAYSHSICNGNSYLFNGQNLTTTGVYLDTLNSFGGCDSIVTLNLSLATVTTGSYNHTVCNGNSYLFNGQYLSIAGAYLDTLTASGGCDSILTLNLSVSVNSAGTINQSICSSGSYFFNGQNLSAAGAYLDTLTASGGCDSIVTLNLSVANVLIGSFNQSICNGNSYLFNGQNLSGAGSYIDTLTASGGCDSIVTLNLSILPNAISTQSVVACSHTGYTLHNGTTLYSSGIFSDTAASVNGCDSIITINLTINQSPIITISPNITILQGTAATLTATGGGTYSWNPHLGLNTITGNTVIASPTSTTTYCAYVTSFDGCSDTACVKVAVEIVCPDVDELAIANAFSPNKDNVNDEFCLQGWGNCVQDFMIVIFDRWGEKVFETKDTNFCWDGTYKGKIMDSQVFVYYINAKHTISGEHFHKTGNISLIR